MKTRRIFMSLFAVIICAISVGIFKNAALGGRHISIIQIRNEVDSNETHFFHSSFITNRSVLMRM